MFFIFLPMFSYSRSCHMLLSIFRYWKEGAHIFACLYIYIYKYIFVYFHIFEYTFICADIFSYVFVYVLLLSVIWIDFRICLYISVYFLVSHSWPLLYLHLRALGTRHPSPLPMQVAFHLRGRWNPPPKQVRSQGTNKKQPPSNREQVSLVICRNCEPWPDYRSDLSTLRYAEVRYFYLSLSR